MTVLGFGVSGVVSSVFNDIHCRPNSCSLIERLQSSARFPYIQRPPFRVFSYEVILDVHFGKLGTSEAVLLIDTGRSRISVFIQAKVSGAGRYQWDIHEELDRFLEGPGSPGFVTNLFSELYGKLRLVDGLRTVGIEGLGKGIEYPPSASGKTTRKIGSNLASIRALQRISRFTDAAFFISILPISHDEGLEFFTDRFSQIKPDGFMGWNTKNYGFMTWKDVENFCSNCGLDNSRNNFYFNRDQIYP